MAVIEERYDSRRNVGKPAFADYLNAFVVEREAMNAETAPDLKRLMDAEADARGKIADLRERQAILRGKKEEISVKSSDKAAELKTRIKVASIAAGAQTTSADRAFRLGMQKLYSERAAVVAEKMLVPAEAAAVIESATARTTSTVDTTSARRTAMEKAKASEGTQEADVVDFAIWQGLRKRDAALGTKDAQVYADDHFGGAPEEYMARAYSVKSPEEVEEMARRVSKEIGGSGADPAIVDGWIKAEMLPSIEMETSTRERGGVDPKHADELEKAIGDLTAYADGLAEQRRNSATKRFPKGHSFLVNPNSFTEQEGWDALGRFGENDREWNRQALGYVQREGGDWKKAHEAIKADNAGGLDGTRGRDAVPDLLEDGLDIREWLFGAVKAQNAPVVVKDGDWTYEVKSDGTTTIVGVPATSPKAKGKTYAYDKDSKDPVYLKIMEKVAASPEWVDRKAAAGVLAAQPEGVRSLFSGVADLVRKGDVAGAATATFGVTADDVRWAYADALEADPGAAAVAIQQLPESVLGSFGSSVLHTLDTPMRSQQDIDAVRGNLSGIGRAVKDEQDPERRARKRGLETQDRNATEVMLMDAPDAPRPLRQVEGAKREDVAYRSGPDGVFSLRGERSAEGRASGADVDLEPGVVDPTQKDAAEEVVTVSVKPVAKPAAKKAEPKPDDDLDAWLDAELGGTK